MEDFALRLERIGVEAFRQVALAAADGPDRDAARIRARAIAADAGLGAVAADAEREVRDYMLRAYSASNYRATWLDLNWGFGLGPTRDRLAAILAAQDAALAAIVEPLVDEGLLATLDGPLATIEAGARARDGYETPNLLDLRRAPGGLLVGLVAIVSLAVTFAGLWIAGLWPIIAISIIGVAVVVGVARRRRDA